jgi:hypothetical protein
MFGDGISLMNAASYVHISISSVSTSEYESRAQARFIHKKPRGLDFHATDFLTSLCIVQHCLNPDSSIP